LAKAILYLLDLSSFKDSVLPRLVKSPYKIYFLNKPYFMRVRKRIDFEKIGLSVKRIPEKGILSH